MIIDEDLYLEHWGVKGMRWGVRKERKKSGRQRLTGGERVGVIAGSYLTGSIVAAKIFEKTGNLAYAQLGYPVMIAVGLTGRRFLLNNRKVKMSTVRTKASTTNQDDEIKKVEEFIKKNAKT